jgi:glycosyltransferase involved in cell wall biosynthesis
LKIGVFTQHGDAQIGGGATFPNEIIRGLRAHASRHEFYSLSFFGPNAPDDGRLSLTGKERQKDFLGRISRGLRSRIPFGIGPRTGKNILSSALNNLAETYGLDAIYYPTPQFIRSKIPTITTLWDLAHRLYPFFPEVNFEGWTWEERETFYQESLPRSAAVITGTETGREQAIHYYGLNPARVKVLPFPTPSFVYDVKASQAPGFCNSLKRPFVFYPAQFWPHKNHYNLIRAIAELVKGDTVIDLVICGSDQGNLNHVKQVIEKFKMSNHVQILGFISREDMLWLYKNCRVMVFPSYFGPDNLPPLEAMAMGTPVAAADIDGAREQLGDAAQYFDPNNPADIAKQITKLLRNQRLRTKLRYSGRILSQKRSLAHYIDSLIAVFDEIEPMRNCWGKPFIQEH